MANKSHKSELAALEDPAWTVARDMCDLLTKEPPPVKLRVLADRWSIKRVRFEPLWSTAGLVPCEGGFEIWIDPQSPAALTEGSVVESEDVDNFEPPLRFVVAHEISHLIFHHVAQERKKIQLLEKCGDRLEKVCNEMARFLLVPPRPLFELLDGRVFDPPHLSMLRERFGVSLDVLVYRLALPDVLREFTSAEGIIAYAMEREGYLRVEAIQAFGAQARYRFQSTLSEGKATGMRPPLDRDLGIPGIEGRIRAKWECDESIVVPGAGDYSLSARLTVCRVSKKPLRVLFAISIAGLPERALRQQELHPI